MAKVRGHVMSGELICKICTLPVQVLVLVQDKKKSF